MPKTERRKEPTKGKRNRRKSFRYSDIERAVIKAEENAITVKDVGTLVQYWYYGLRVGHLVEIKGKMARIRPIAPYKSTEEPRCKLIKLEDVKKIHD